MLTLGIVILSALMMVAEEPALEKRAVKAVDTAGAALTEARKQYEQGEIAKFDAALTEVAKGAELAIASLEAMGKHPSKNTRNYKAVEMKMRELLRRIETFRQDCGVEERPKVERVEKRVTEIHEKLVEGVMSRKP